MVHSEDNPECAAPGDYELLQRFAREGSQSAFDLLVSRHVDLVYSSACRQTSNPDAAQDVTQAVFLLLARKAGKFSRNAVLPGWLYRTTRFVAYDHLKAERRRKLRERKAWNMQTLEREEGSSDSDWAHLAPVLDELMARLNGKDRDVLLLRYFKQLSLKEVGETLGLSEEAAKKRSARALDKLRHRFRQRGIAIAGTALATHLSAHVVEAAPASLTASVSTSIAGGASSASTALAQGGWKWMAWAQAKTILLTLGVASLAGGAGFALQRPSPPAVDLDSFLAYPGPVNRGSLKGALHHLGASLNSGNVAGFLDGFTGNPSETEAILPTLGKAAENVDRHRSNLLASLRTVAAPVEITPLDFWESVVRRIEAAVEVSAEDRGFLTMDEGYSLPFHRQDGQWKVVVANDSAVGATGERLLREIRGFDTALLKKQTEVQTAVRIGRMGTLGGRVTDLAKQWARSTTLWLDDRFEDRDPRRTGDLDAAWSLANPDDTLEVTETLQAQASFTGPTRIQVLSGVFAGGEGAALGSRIGDQLRMELDLQITGTPDARSVLRLGLYRPGEGTDGRMETGAAGYRLDVDCHSRQAALRKEFGDGSKPVSGPDSIILGDTVRIESFARPEDRHTLALTLTRASNGVLLQGSLDGVDLVSTLDTELSDESGDGEGTFTAFHAVAVGLFRNQPGGLQVHRVRVESHAGSAGRGLLAHATLTLAGIFLAMFVAAPAHFVVARIRFKLRGYGS